MNLLLATPCQLVIQDKEGGGQSLIGVFHHLKIQISKDAEVPKNAMIPKDWALFSKWKLEPSEANRSIKQRIEAFWPNGEELFKVELVAADTVDNQAAFIIRHIGFPIGQNGIFRIIFSIFADNELAHDPVTVNMAVDVIKDL